MDLIICDYCHDKIEKTNTLEHLKCCKFFNQFIEKIAAYECTLCYVKMFQDIEMFCHLKQAHNDVILEKSKIIHNMVSNKGTDSNYGVKIMSEVHETNELKVDNEYFESSEIDPIENLVLLPNDEGLIDNDSKINSEVHVEKEFVTNIVKKIETNSKENIVKDQNRERNNHDTFCQFLSEVEEAEEFEIGIDNKSFKDRKKDEKEIVMLNVGDISKTNTDENLEFSNSESFVKKVTEEEEELANYFCNRDKLLLCQGGLQTRKLAKNMQPGNKTESDSQFVKKYNDIEKQAKVEQENVSPIAKVKKENQANIEQEKGPFGTISERKEMKNKIEIVSSSKKKQRSSKSREKSFNEDNDLQNKQPDRKVNYISERYQRSFLRKDIDTDCQICSRKFSRNFDMRRHMKLVHKKIVVKKRKFFSKECPFCSKKFTRHSGMKKHMKLVHKEENIEHEIAKPTNQGSQPKRNCTSDITSTESDESVDDLN